MIWKVRPIAAPNPGFMIQLKALEKNVMGDNSECEVMQGMWKDKLDALKAEKAAKIEAGEIVSPLKVPTQESMIANADKQNLGGLAPKRFELEDSDEEKANAKAKELQDGMEQLQVKEKEKSEKKLKELSDQKLKEKE